MPIILMVGGPADGKTLQVPDEGFGQPIRVPVLRDIVARYTDADALHAETVQTDVVEYVHTRYDHQVRVHVYTPRPAPSGELPRPSGGHWRWCRGCDVKWWGDEVCWYCDQTVTDSSPVIAPPGASRWPAG